MPGLNPSTVTELPLPLYTTCSPEPEYVELAVYSVPSEGSVNEFDVFIFTILLLPLPEVQEIVKELSVTSEKEISYACVVGAVQETASPSILNSSKAKSSPPLFTETLILMSRLLPVPEIDFVKFWNVEVSCVPSPVPSKSVSSRK